MFSIKRKQNKYEVEVQLSFPELIDMLPLEASCASVDIEPRLNADYRLIEGDLYAHLPENKAAGMQGQKETWWFFDVSCRRWQKCDDPKS